MLCSYVRSLLFAVLAASPAHLLAQVPNDEPTTAIVVTNGISSLFTNVGSTTSSPAWPCTFNAGRDVWFLYQAPAAGTLTVGTCSLASYDTCLEVLDGRAGYGSLASLGCIDDACGLQSALSVTLPGPGVYYMRVGGYNLNTGTFALNIGFTASGPASGNDECSGAIVLGDGISATYTNVGSTTSFGWPCAAGGSDIWFLYQAAYAGPFTVQTCGLANYDTALQIFDGANGCGSLTSLGCNDDFCGLQSRVSTTLPSPGVYYIRVGGFAALTGSFALNISGPGVVATANSLGSGCGTTYNSFYQILGNASTAAAALNGGTLALTAAGSGYQGEWLPGTAAANFVPPAGGTPLAVGDDGVVNYTLITGAFPTPQGPQSTLKISGNAIIAWGAAAMDYPGTNSYTPAVNGFLNSALGGIYAWHDYNANEGGQVLAHEALGVLYVTFNNVENYPGGVVNPSTLQFQLSLVTGSVRIVFLNIDSNNSSIWGTSHLVGVTAPGASSDPGSIALSTAFGGLMRTADPEVPPMVLLSTTRPITGTTWSLDVTSIPPNGAVGVDVFGTADPGLNDLAFLGAPGCGLRASVDVTQAWFVAGGTHGYSLAIPNQVALLGANLFTTSAVFQFPPVNALGAVTSNGVNGTIGNN